MGLQPDEVGNPGNETENDPIPEKEKTMNRRNSETYKMLTQCRTLSARRRMFRVRRFRPSPEDYRLHMTPLWCILVS